MTFLKLNYDNGSWLLIPIDEVSEIFYNKHENKCFVTELSGTKHTCHTVESKEM
jgi:hypothetical protein